MFASLFANSCSNLSLMSRRQLDSRCAFMYRCSTVRRRSSCSFFRANASWSSFSNVVLFSCDCFSSCCVVVMDCSKSASLQISQRIEELSQAIKHVIFTFDSFQNIAAWFVAIPFVIYPAHPAIRPLVLLTNLHRQIHLIRVSR